MDEEQATCSVPFTICTRGSRRSELRFRAAAMLAVLASAADAVEKERAAYAPAFAPLRADPPSAAALAFAARARGTRPTTPALAGTSGYVTLTLPLTRPHG